ncbi:MAG: hypothetical protein IPK19_12795 [Chloroflexi bacterium]|nr:hypothetical protein [Chloroflexota bacterium]
MRKLLRLSLAVVLLVVVLSSFAVSAAGESYRRWIEAGKTYTCTQSGASVEVLLNNQDVEFSNLPASAQFTINYIKNGLTSTDGPFPVEQTSGTKNYGSFAVDFPSYPLTFEFRLDTLIDGEVVYQSSIIIDCAADTAAPQPVTVENVVTLAYRRWLDDGKVFTCTQMAGFVQVLLNNQNVEFVNLPVDAQFTINYIRNGVTTTDGPYVVEQTSGTKNYASFQETFPSYPLTFEFRLDTLINGIVVYESSIGVSCSADAVVPVTPVNGPPTPAEGTPVALKDCAAGLPSGSVQGRLLETVVGLYEPDAGAATNVTLAGGTSWWIIGAEGGFYELWIACQAAPMWVPASAVGPNYDSGGAALPDAGT